MCIRIEDGISFVIEKVGSVYVAWFEVEERVRLGVESMEEEFDSIRFCRIFAVTNSRIAWLFVSRAPLVPYTTLGIFCYYESGKTGIGWKLTYRQDRQKMQICDQNK